jgi:hypothetical protein
LFFPHTLITSLYASALELDPFEVSRSNKLFHAAQGLLVFAMRAAPVAYNHPQAARFVSCGGVIFYGDVFLRMRLISVMDVYYSACVIFRSACAHHMQTTISTGAFVIVLAIKAQNILIIQSQFLGSYMQYI